MNSHLTNTCYCQNCGQINQPIKKNKGSIAAESGLLLSCLMFGAVNIVYGFIMFAAFIVYCLWRLSSKYNICPSCKSDQIIPANSPIV